MPAHRTNENLSNDSVCFSLLCIGYSFIPTDADDVPAFVQSFLPEVQAPVVQTEGSSSFVWRNRPNVLLGSVVLMSRMGSVRVTTAGGPMWSQAPHNELQALLELLVEIEHLLAGCERQGKFFSGDHSGRPSP